MEWMEALKMNDFGITDSLVDRLKDCSLVDSALSSSSAALTRDEVITILKCLALSGNILPSIWQLYSDSLGVEKVLQLTDTVVGLVTSAIDVKLASSPKKARPNSVPYAGFDMRDIVDYNVCYDEGDAAIDEDEQLREQQLQQLDESLELYLLVLCQLYGRPLSSLSHRLEYEKSTPSVEISIEKKCLYWCERTLLYTNKVDEAFFLQALKFVCLVNFHFDTSEISLQNQSSPVSR